MVGLQFRLLTFWGLTGAVSVAWLMLSLSRKGLPPGHDALVSAVAVLNGIVVFLYWKIYFIDPALVNGSGPIVWYQEYYLHAVGPDLMIADALFINGALKQRHKGLLLTVLICLAYIFWTEVITRLLNDTPIGSVASGLPYPFLNDMTLPRRIGFYATTIANSLLMYLASWMIGIMFPKLSFQPSA
jgi:hypothetical protein